jgi:2,4-dienoyl-CoA reductase-like NADH-dependent reductase (Old Yellow Enzyme family)/thioredoxin reductase
MADMALSLIWQPIRIGPLELPNRIARAANTTTISQAGIDEQFIAYHRARARAGVGLSILEAASVHPTSILSYAIDDAACAGFERLMKEIRPYGMRVIQQLWHGGHHIPGLGGRLPWTASDVPSPFSGMVGHTASVREIEELVESFASAARRCRDAGIDGVEIHAGHGYLVQQFLSPLTNTRTDGYGGSLENRMRFAVEILRAVRREVGQNFAVGIRMSASTARGNISAAELGQVARVLEAEGLIDFLDASYGDYFEMDRMSATMAEPAGYELVPDQALLESVSVPRMVTGRFRTLEEAEQVLRSRSAEIVSLVRAHIADPELVRKTREGRAEAVRPCIACNQGCVGGLLQVARMGCAVNPSAGAEAILDESLIERAARPKKVLIVGGGPAGMEAARIAALRGHHAVLVEAGAHLGGALRAARLAPRLHTIADIVDWHEREISRLGVEVRTSTFLEPEEVLAESPDVLIVATGAADRDDGMQVASPAELPPGCGLPHVTNAHDLLIESARDFAPAHALVLDDVGHYEAVAAAEFLAERGTAVTYVTGQPAFAPRLNGTFRNEVALKRLYAGRFRLLVGHFLAAVETRHCVVRPLRAVREEIIPADAVVLVTHKTPRRTLYDALRDQLAEVRLVGDASSPRTLQDAIREGHLAARFI